MTFLIDIGHPAHVHLYRNLYFELLNKNHKVIVTVRDIQIVRELLVNYKIPFIVLGKKSDTLFGKLLDVIKINLKIIKIVKKNNVDKCIGSTLNITHVSLLTKAKSILFDDDDDRVQPLMTYFGHPFATVLVSPDVLSNKRRRKDTIFYPGFHELAYLHPNRFYPDESVLESIGLEKGEVYFVLRFNSFKAHHDKGVRGLTHGQKIQLIEKLKPYGKVFVTTERYTEIELADYKLTIDPDKIHSLLYFSSMFIGDSQTMTSEAALLGVPAFRCNSLVGNISYLDELEKKYELAFGYLPDQFTSFLDKVIEIAELKNAKSEWNKRRGKLINDKFDVTQLMLSLAENT